MGKQTEVKVTLPPQIKKLLEEKASSYGMTQAAFVRHLIFQAVADMPNAKRNITREEVQELMDKWMQRKLSNLFYQPFFFFGGDDLEAHM